MKKKHKSLSSATAKAASVGGPVPSGPMSIRTPWGVFDMTRHDEDARDPLEPDDPITLYPDRSGRAAEPQTDDTAPISPRELYEMLMAPAAAATTRSSPVRHSDQTTVADGEPLSTAFPPQADMVLSALEVGRAAAPGHDRRALTRRSYRVRATLRLHSDQAGTAPRVLFTRDVHSRGIGFITQHRLPLGYGGVIELPDPKGGPNPLHLTGTLLRCREAVPGWFEGSIYFSREISEFDEI